MKSLKQWTTTVLTAGLLLSPLALCAADKKTDKPKPYPLTTCVVSDEKLGADPSMQPYVFTHEGREIKLCCKSCLKDFKKDTASYIKKIEAAEKKK
ncbi:MAG TPA: hypothetical protein VGK40_10705 [Verrucomicrobiae bacterium]